MSTSSVIRVLFFAQSLVIVFHVGVCLQWIPSTIAWGGRLQTNAELYVFEAISLAVNLFLMLLLARRAGWINGIVSDRMVRVGFFVFAGVFALNTLGNLLATTWVERSFSLITAAYVVALIHLARTSRR